MKNVFLIFILLVAIADAQFPCNKVSFINRTGWNAQRPTRIYYLTRKPLSFYLIHHTVNPPRCFSDESCNKGVKNIQIYHKHVYKWDDIAYNFLVGENGKVYEGRGWNHEASHSKGWNANAYSIAIIGNFMNASPKKEALNAIRLWMDCGVALGNVKAVYYVLPHRQTQRIGYTESPGNNLTSIVRQWPQYCSYQNTGSTLQRNETQISLALNFCAKKSVTLSSTASQRLASMLLTSILFIHCAFKNCYDL